MADTPSKIEDDGMLLVGADFNDVHYHCDPHVRLCSTGAPEGEGMIRTLIDEGVEAFLLGCSLWLEVTKESMRARVNTDCGYGEKPAPAAGSV